MDDWQLLRRFVENNSQEAFADLMARYLRLVYSVCRRELADAETAEDVTQAVFLILARKAPALRRSVILSGWLFQTARFAAKNARVQAQRRADYEQKAAKEMGQQRGPEDADWAEIEPLLNRSLAGLGTADRECVLLRYFQEMTFVEIGVALGLTEEAARKRLTRALEKMRRFFGKEGVTVPELDLAVLLSTHTVKAVPATCQANAAALTSGVLAGHLPLGLVGSHVYQLSEGALKAMKIAQLKIAASLVAMAVIGGTAYAAAKGGTLIVTSTHKMSPLLTVSKSGHVLTQPPGKTLTATQIAARCREAYGALQSYQGTTVGTTRAVTGPTKIPSEYHTSADIRFARPDKLQVEGKDVSGGSFSYVSNGGVSFDKNIITGGVWQKSPSIDTGIARITGATQFAATTIPALLLALKSSNFLAATPTFAPEVREDNVDGQPCYLMTSPPETSDASMSRNFAISWSFWVDEKTFLLRRCLGDISGPVNGTAVQSQIDQRFTNERLNAAIPDSAFTLPPSQ